jgi:hypothetical protein
MADFFRVQSDVHGLLPAELDGVLVGAALLGVFVVAVLFVWLRRGARTAR